jgi:hypothetical protein
LSAANILRRAVVIPRSCVFLGNGALCSSAENRQRSDFPNSLPNSARGCLPGGGLKLRRQQAQGDSAMTDERGDTAGDDQRQIEVMKHLRRINMRRLAEKPPPGFRVSDDGASATPDGDRNWPVNPFDPFCSRFCWPDLELFTSAKQVVPDFDPSEYALSWRLLTEAVLHTGRPLDQVEQMSFEDIKAFLIHRIEACKPSHQIASKPGADKDQKRNTRPKKVDADLRSMEKRLRKQFEKEGFSGQALHGRLVAELYSLSSAELVALRKTMGFRIKVSERTIRRSETYGRWKKYRHPAAPPSRRVDCGPGALSDVSMTESEAAAAEIIEGNLGNTTNPQGHSRQRKTQQEVSHDVAASEILRAAGLDPETGLGPETGLDPEMGLDPEIGLDEED